MVINYLRMILTLILLPTGLIFKLACNLFRRTLDNQILLSYSDKIDFQTDRKQPKNNPIYLYTLDTKILIPTRLIFKLTVNHHRITLYTYIL